MIFNRIQTFHKIRPSLGVQIFSVAAFLAALQLILALAEYSGILNQPLVMDFYEKYFSPDGKISNTDYYNNVLIIFNLWLICFCIFNIRFFDLKSGIPLNNLRKYVIFALALILVFILVQPSEQAVKLFFSFEEIPTTLEGILYAEDGLLESLTALLFLLAGIHAFQAGKIAIQEKMDCKISSILFLGGFLCWLLFLEEISWGQRLFGWQTPDPIAAINFQKETNVHNFFNPLLGNAERIFAIFLSMLLFILPVLREKIKSLPARAFIPAKEYFYASLILVVPIFAEGPFRNELLEVVLSVFVLAYTIEVRKHFSRFQERSSRKTGWVKIIIPLPAGAPHRGKSGHPR
ncbi:MAG: hypothetical protein ACE5E9_09735 [Nitrospinaceae bacterium]